jgi:hypothetical protein
MGEEDKYAFLRPLAVFRFEFTLTALKWGAGLGFCLGLHQFLKSHSLVRAYNWAFMGFLTTSLPIWGFLYGKYNLHSLSLRRY